MAATATLNVPWSIPKTRPFMRCQRFIGFDWDLAALTVIFPEEKLTATRNLVHSWLNPTLRVHMREAASFHGKLVHASTIFPLIRPFLRSISRFATAFKSPRASLGIPGAVRSDAKWISDLLSRLPNSLPLSQHQPADIGWWGDASSSFGIGVVVGSFWAVWRYAPGVTVGPRRRFDIGWAEAVAVELGLHLATHHALLEQRSPHTSRILVRSDNSGVVHAVNRGRSRSAETNSVLRRTYLQLADAGISLVAKHVASEENIADPLSRGDVAGFLCRFPAATTRSDCSLPPSLCHLLRSW